LFKKKSKILALLLALVMVVSTVQPAFAASFSDGLETSGLTVDAGSRNADVPVATTRGPAVEATEYLDFLLSTMYAEPVRMTGFYLYYELPENLYELVDIVVQFTTPPSVALRLIAEATATQRPFGESAQMADSFFEPQALDAHNRFMSQLAMADVPAGMQEMAVLGAHYTLFNGKFMSVPAGAVEIIANLPEVFLVTPAFEYFPMAQLAGYVGTELVVNVGYADIVPAYAGYIPHPEFNQGAIDLFNIPYIHNTIGVTGAGIRVGVLDTGIDYRHPIFYDQLVYIGDIGSSWGAVERGGRMYTLPGANFLATDPCSIWGHDGGQRFRGPNSSPAERASNGVTNHGTHVAGTVLAMAPGIELWGYRVIGQGPGGTQAGSVVRAIEHAYIEGLDVINLSLGNRINTPWQSNSYALNLAMLAGVISTNSAGNDGEGGNPRTAGRGGWFSLGGGSATSTLGITVGAGVAGGRLMDVQIGGHVDNQPAVMSLIGHWPGFNLATDTPAGNIAYTWFGMMTIPGGGATNPAFPAFVDDVRNNILGGSDLDGEVVVINRGGGEFVTMRDLAIELGAAALLVINNQPANVLLTGTVLNNIDPANSIPIYSIGAADGANFFGAPLPAPAFGEPDQSPNGVGILNFGTPGQIAPPDVMAGFSSIGPLGPFSVPNDPYLAPQFNTPLMHLAPDIVAPGVSILSANNIDDPTTIGGGHYVVMGGTSMSAPAVAGIAALMVEQFPSATPLEIKARMMQTSRPLTGYSGTYSVLQVGAGFIVPIDALRSTAFATANHPTPFGGSTAWGPGGTIDVEPGILVNHDMASLSFGRVEIYEDVPGASDIIPVTIHGLGTWTHSFGGFIMPTQALLPADGNMGTWGPRLDFTDAGVGLVVEPAGGNTFNIHLTHNGLLENRGFAQGYISFSNGSQTLTLPLGAYFDIEVPPVPLEPNPDSVIWTPIISGFINTPSNAGAEDIRAFPFNAANFGWYPGDVGIITRSNYSSFSFGFIDPNNGPARPIRFYFGPYGTDFADKELFSTAAPLSPGAFTHYFNPVRAIKGGTSWTVGPQTNGVFVVEGPATVLTPGVWTMTVVVVHGAGEAFDLRQPFHFVVTGDRPTIDFDEDIFVANGTATVTGRINSFGHDLAALHNLYGALGWPLVSGPTTYAQTLFRVGAAQVPVAADGTFSFNMPEPPQGIATFNAVVDDMEGLVVIPPGNITFSGANMSEITSFTVASQAFLDALEQLGNLITVAEGTIASNYTLRSFARLQEALIVATAALEPPTTITALLTAISALQAAIDTLVPMALLNNLQAAIAHAESLNPAHFNRGSWTMMQQVLAAARSYAANPEVTGESLATMTASLWGAINNLVIIGVNWVVLDEVIGAAQLIQPASVSRSQWAQLQEALSAAVFVRGDTNASQMQADAAVANLNAVLNSIAAGAPTLPPVQEQPSLPVDPTPPTNPAPPTDPTLPIEPPPPTRPIDPTLPVDPTDPMPPSRF
jgi:subtilisin family serine protease